MLNKIYQWLVEHNFQISWFYIGFFVSEFFQDAARGNWLGAVLDVVFVVFGYAMVRDRG